MTYQDLHIAMVILERASKVESNNRSPAKYIDEPNPKRFQPSTTNKNGKECNINGKECKSPCVQRWRMQFFFKLLN